MPPSPALVLRTIAQQTAAETGALALFSDCDAALTIVETVGYPLAIVEHLRIEPGEGLMGSAFASGKAVIGNARHDRARRSAISNRLLHVVAPVRRREAAGRYGADRPE